MRKLTGFYNEWGRSVPVSLLSQLYSSGDGEHYRHVATLVSHGPQANCDLTLTHRVSDCGCYHDADVESFEGRDGHGWH